MWGEQVADKPHRLDLQARFYVAGIALLASIVGAGAGAYGAISAANINADRLAQVNRDNFNKQQRVTVYTNYYKTIIQFPDVATQLIGALGVVAAVSEGKPGASYANLPQYSAYTALQKSYSDSLSAVFIGGSTRMGQIALVTNQANIQLKRYMDEIFHLVSAGKSALAASKQATGQAYTFNAYASTALAQIRKELY